MPSMRLAGYQPQYFPRLHYFARLLDSDIFEFSDYVQFVKKHAYHNPDGTSTRGRSFQADTVIKTNQGPAYLTVPVRQEGLAPINQTMLDNTQSWVKKHLKTIRIHYGRAPQFTSIFPSLTKLLDQPYNNLAELNIQTVVWALAWLLTGQAESVVTVQSVNKLLAEVKHPFRLKKIIILSQTSIKPPGENRDATTWIIDICRELGANEYYFGGTSARAYMNFELLKQAGITTLEQDWQCAPYTQQYSQQKFIPNLSIIDLLFNERFDRAQQILQG